MKDFQKLQDSIGEWSDGKFGSLDPRGSIKHMRDEVSDLLSNPYDVENIADVGILFIESCRRAGFNMDEVYQAMDAKHKINVSRIWEKPDSLGVTKHRKEED